MDIKKNMDINLNIETVTSEGSGLGRYNGIAVFVFGAIPGDEIVAHIIKVSKNYAIGKIKEIVTPSPKRIKSDCPVFEMCGGCAFRTMNYCDELVYKKERVQDAINRIAHLDLQVNDIVFCDNETGYRNKAQYPVSIENGEAKVGFYAVKSHRIVENDNCLLQPKEFECGIKAFKQWAKENNVSSYDSASGKGLVRHLYFRKAFGTNEVMACLVINGNDIPNREAFVLAMKNAFENLKSVQLNVNKAKTNVILGKKNITIFGSDYITDVLMNKKFVVSPNSFYQVNHDGCEKLYSIAKKEAGLTGEETLVDIYCGAGTIGLSLADDAKMLYGIEIVEDAVENAKTNAKLNGVTNAEFILADAFEGAKILEEKGVKADVVVLDPPRKGCQKELIELVAKMEPKRIVYVSCDPATLSRDIAVFDELGFKTQHITPVDMFPRTTHVECVVLMSKVQK